MTELPDPRPEIAAVEFHFDIMCPWAYQASLWIRDVRDQLGLEIGRAHV
jgi:protein-disulfide isomerase-like protein with CxxC motif